MAKLHLMKLSVGTTDIADLATWQDSRRRATGHPNQHVTRMWPKREAELLQGGSIYWVIKGVMQARQRLIALEEVIGEDGIRRCALVLDPQIYRTAPTPRRAFQGWRYLAPSDAPPDLGPYQQGQPELPSELEQGLAALGVL